MADPATTATIIAIVRGIVISSDSEQRTGLLKFILTGVLMVLEVMAKVKTGS